MDALQFVTTDNVAILILLVAVWKLWDRNTTLEDRKTEMAVNYAESMNTQASVLNKAIEKLEQAYADRSA